MSETISAEQFDELIDVVKRGDGARDLLYGSEFPCPLFHIPVKTLALLEQWAGLCGEEITSDGERMQFLYHGVTFLWSRS